MRIVVIGGTGFIGPHVVRELARIGHSVVVFNRGSTNPDLPAEHVFGDHRDLATHRPKADTRLRHPPRHRGGPTRARASH